MKNNIEKNRLFGLRGKKQRGFTLLEYCAGAAVLAGIVWVAMDGLGGSMRDYLNNLAGWFNARSGNIELDGGDGGTGGTGGTGNTGGGSTNN